MKNYKQYEKISLGASDIAALTMVGCDNDGNLMPKILKFGMDACYSAYVVDDDAEVGSHYKLVSEFCSWLKIYDDIEATVKFEGNKIKVFRAAETGCIIQVINKQS